MQLFRVSEKTATPTSVVLMAGNTLIGFYWRQLMMQGIDMISYEYLAVCAPIVVVGAPLGSVFGSYFHRQVLASFNYFADTVALVSGFVIVKQDAILIAISIGIIVFGFVFFGLLCYLGHVLMHKILEEWQDFRNECKEKREILIGSSHDDPSCESNDNERNDEITSKIETNSSCATTSF